ncbi:hypothetical protein EDC01DRAFT_123843 [Geopyxis carbonaria]|nr:hypothetical protein EDC01DRAFT_123843 [Geopyxis carbonaria]
MSLESALEEERLEILKLLERPQKGKSSSHPSGTYSTPSSPRLHYSSLNRTASPRRNVNSLIDAVADIVPPSRNIGPGSGTASPGSINGSYPGSPVSGVSNGLHRTRSDASTQGPRLLGHKNSTASILTPNNQYNFSMIPSVGGTGIPKKRHNSAGSKAYGPQQGGFQGRSKSPLTSAMRSQSPRGSSARLASPAPIETGNRLVSENGELIDLDHAYARLTDDALARSGGMLGNLPERRPVLDSQGEYVRAGTGESVTRDGGLRLQKDIDPNEKVTGDSTEEDSSEDDSGRSLSEEEERRGRTGLRSPRSAQSLVEAASEPGSRGNSSDRDINNLVGLGVDPGGGKKKRGPHNKLMDATRGANYMNKRKPRSLLAAAEEERKTVSSKYKVRSLLPSISVTPSGNGIPGATSPTTARRSGVHPSTNFDIHSATSTPMSSDQEADDLDIRRAQRMETSISPIVSTPESQRVVRTILRGDYEEIQKEAEDGNRRTRKYLVATDLSSEAQYAMEWTIGTVLRDGDTLMAIYAVDQDTVEDGSKPVSESSIGDALLEVGGQSPSGTLTPSQGHTPGASSPLAKEGVIEQSRERTKAERERYVAAEAITGVITKLLKKTRLQVKVVLEVIHCKSPKHLLTEIIDYSEPTLVILGSRGRSALKGWVLAAEMLRSVLYLLIGASDLNSVLLGSFSNYLVTKSSVPVMVARKKLKHTKKYAQTTVRLTNNLTSNSQRILANAKVD